MWYIPVTLDTEAPTARGRWRSPAIAALLSFVWPGLGQLYAGRRRLAAIFAAPAALVLLLLLYQMRQGLLVFGARLVNPKFALAAFLVVVVLGVWRAVSVAHAFLAGEPPKTRRTLQRGFAGALVAIVVLSHSAAGYMLWVGYEAGSKAFSPISPLIVEATQPPSLPPGATPAPATPTATVTEPPIGSRVTILFTGVDADPTRGEQLYDSIMVVSYDPPTNSVQMVSVPRDSASFPLYFGGQVSANVRINSLPTYVRNGWVRSPDPPYTTLVKEIAYLVGIPINYYAVMDLEGFVKMVDMVGGIDVNNPSEINDPSYATPVGTIIGFQLSAGPHHLDGNQALAYVRSRHGSNNSDWARASRQQEVLVSLLHRMSEPSKFLQLPNLISTLGSSVTTNFPAEQVADYVAVGQSIPAGNFKQVVLGPPTYTITNFPHTSSASTTCLLNYRVAELSVQLFGKDSTWYGKPPPANTCPI